MKQVLLISLFLSISCIYGQNQHEPQEWQKLKSKYAEIIFKKEQEKEANQIANTISYIQKNNTKSIGYHNESVSIILRSNTVESNGFVTYSPFRSEFFNTSPTTFNVLGTTDWLSTLAIHEYRHVQQFLNNRAGFSNILYYLAGENGWAIGAGITIPDWYFEGDAVTMETALSESGRGRLPKFTALQRALYQNNKLYSYAKTRNGSYKDLVPNQYISGYQMLNYYRNNFDAEQLDDIARKAASFSFPFYGFSYHMYKATGLGTKKLYKKAALASKNSWQQQRDYLKVTHYTPVSKISNKKQFYNYPQQMDHGKIIVLKSSLDKIPAFYEIDSIGNEAQLKTNIINVENYFNYKNNAIVYTGISYHPRYNYTNYNDIYTYDLTTKKEKRITFKQKYFSPSFNKEATKIIAIEHFENKNALVILNAKTGDIIQKIKVDGFLTRPKFINDDEFIGIKRKNHKISIVKINTKGVETKITQPTSHVIDDICIENNTIYCSASFNGIDNIYKIDLAKNASFKQVTNTAIGAYQPNVKNGTVYFKEVTANGSIVAKSNKPATSILFKEPTQMDWNNSKTVAFENGNILNKIDSTQHKAVPYTSIFRGLKLHTWEYSYDRSLITSTILATNLLNDFAVNTYTKIYRNTNSYDIGVQASYKKWYPVLNLSLEYLNRNFNTSPFESNQRLLKVSPSVAIPLAQVKGNYTNSLNLELGYEHLHAFHLYHKTFDKTLKGRASSAANVNLQVSSIRRKAFQNINVRAGFLSNTTFSKTFNSSVRTVFKTTNTLFLPGFIANHNSFVTFQYHNNKFNLGSGDTFNYARGYKVNPSEKAIGVSINYQLPILYPDFGFAGIAYFKRLRANLFGDFTKIRDSYYSDYFYPQKQQSLGFELILDTTFLNLKEIEIGIGYRGSWLLQTDRLQPKENFVSGLVINTTLF